MLVSFEPFIEDVPNVEAQQVDVHLLHEDQVSVVFLYYSKKLRGWPEDRTLSIYATARSTTGTSASSSTATVALQSCGSALGWAPASVRTRSWAGC